LLNSHKKTSNYADQKQKYSCENLKTTAFWQKKTGQKHGILAKSRHSRHWR